MTYPTKIATCCYCGTRAALVLTGTERHELACSACGAPLHDLKMLKAAKTPKPAVSHRATIPVPKPKKTKPRKKKSRPRFAKLFEEAFDVIEDIFD